MSTEAIWITILASLSTGLFGIVLGHLWSSVREKPQGKVETDAHATPAIQQQVNINLPSSTAGTQEAEEITKGLPDPGEMLRRLDDIAGRLHQLELQTADPQSPTGSFHSYEFSGQFMSQLHWFARWYETFTVDVGLLLIEVVEADNSLRLESALHGDPLGVLPGRGAAVDEALRKGVLMLTVASEGALLSLTEKGRELLEGWRSWGSQAKQ